MKNNQDSSLLSGKSANSATSALDGDRVSYVPKFPLVFRCNPVTACQESNNAVAAAPCARLAGKLETAFWTPGRVR